MQEVFEKIIEELEELKKCGTKHYEDGEYIYTSPDYDHETLNKAIEIVKQEAEKYNNGWIPVKDRLPETDDEVLVSVRMKDSGEEEESLLAISSYREETFGGKGLGYKDWKAAWEYWGYWEVVAWQPLPEPYQPKGE